MSELITLNEFGRAIISSFDVKDILGYVSKSTTRLLSADGCTVRLAAEGRGGLRVMVDEGYGRPGFRREYRSPGKSLALQVFQQRRPLLINGPEDSPFHEDLSRRGITSFLACLSSPRTARWGSSATTPPPRARSSTWRRST